MTNPDPSKKIPTVWVILAALTFLVAALMWGSMWFYSTPESPDLVRIRAISLNLAAENEYRMTECINATERLWYALRAAGFNPKIVAGNVTAFSGDPREVNHVWITVEDPRGIG